MCLNFLLAENSGEPELPCKAVPSYCYKCLNCLTVLSKQWEILLCSIQDNTETSPGWATTIVFSFWKSLQYCHFHGRQWSMGGYCEPILANIMPFARALAAVHIKLMHLDVKLNLTYFIFFFLKACSTPFCLEYITHLSFLLSSWNQNPSICCADLWCHSVMCWITKP